MTTNDQDPPQQQQQQQQQQQHQQAQQAAQHEIYTTYNNNNYSGSSSSTGNNMSGSSHASESPVRSQPHLPHLQDVGSSPSSSSAGSSNNSTTTQSSSNANAYFSSPPHLHPLQQIQQTQQQTLPHISQLPHHANNLLRSPSSTAASSSAHFGSNTSSTYANYSPPPMLESSGLPPPHNARELASFCYKTGEDRRVQPMCFDQGEVLVLEHKSLGLKKEVCSKNQRLQITQRRDSKNVVIVTSVEIWLLTGDGKPRPEPDVSSIFKFRCIEEQDDLFILVEKSGIPIVYGTRPPDRNKDPAALYVVRMNFKRPNSTTLEHVDFTLHKKQRSTAVGANASKKRTREDDANSHSNGPMMGNNMGNASLNHLMGVKKESDPNGDSPMRVIPQFQTLVHPQHPQHMGQQFHHQFQQSLPHHFPPILHQHPSLSAQHQAQLQQAQLLAQQQYIAQLHAQQQFPLHPSVYGQSLSHSLNHPSLIHTSPHSSHSSLHNLPLVSFPPPSILQGQSPQQQQQQQLMQHQQNQNQNPSSPHAHHPHGNYESTREGLNAEAGQS